MVDMSADVLNFPDKQKPIKLIHLKGDELERNRVSIEKLISRIFKNSTPRIKQDDHFIIAYMEDKECNSKSNISKSNQATLLGFLHFSISRKKILLNGIGVDKNFRGMGIGKLLMKELTNLFVSGNYSEIILKVKSTNSIALRLYEESGFVLKKVLSSRIKNEEIFLLSKKKEN